MPLQWMAWNVAKNELQDYSISVSIAMVTILLFLAKKTYADAFCYNLFISLPKHLLSYIIFRIRDSTESSHCNIVTLGRHVLCLSLSNMVYLLLGPSL